MTRVVVIALSEFAFEALAGEDRASAGHVPARLGRAIRCYLVDRGSSRVGWRHPDFLPPRPEGARVEIEFKVDAGVWDDLKGEADAQGVSIEQMLDHVALYFASEVDSGRVTQRILGNLGYGAGADSAKGTRLNS